MRAWTPAAWLCAALFAGLSLAAGERPEAAHEVVLDTPSFWRCHFTWKTVQVRRESGELELVSVAWPARRRATLKKAARVIRSPLPSRGGAAPS